MTDVFWRGLFNLCWEGGVMGSCGCGLGKTGKWVWLGCLDVSCPGESIEVFCWKGRWGGRWLLRVNTWVDLCLPTCTEAHKNNSTYVDTTHCYLPDKIKTFLLILDFFYSFCMPTVSSPSSPSAPLTSPQPAPIKKNLPLIDQQQLVLYQIYTGKGLHWIQPQVLPYLSWELVQIGLCVCLFFSF